MTGNFLPYDHPLMRCVRQRVQLLFDRIHPALLLNYDQLWKLSARGTVHVDLVRRDTGPTAVSVERGHNIARDNAEAQLPLCGPHARRGDQKRHPLHEWGAYRQVS